MMDQKSLDNKSAIIEDLAINIIFNSSVKIARRKINYAHGQLTMA
jgi:hypothetical protein